MSICYISSGDLIRRTLTRDGKGIKTVFIASEDHYRIERIVDMRHGDGKKPCGRFGKLERKLDRAVVLEAWAVPPGVVAINSRVHLLDLDTGKTEEWVLTMPENADPDRQHLSILAPIGTAILGFSEGDEVECETPGGVRRFKLQRVVGGAQSKFGIAV